MDFFFMFENNYASVYEQLSNREPEMFVASDPVLNCGWYTTALLIILDQKPDVFDISDFNELAMKIEEHLIQPNAVMELNINQPDEHWSLAVNIPNSGFCAYFEIDEMFNRSIKIMPVRTFCSYILGMLDGKVCESFYGAKIKDREFIALLSFTEEKLTAETVKKFLN